MGDSKMVKCLHPKNYGKECDEGCPERNDFGNSPLDIAIATADYVDCIYIEDYVGDRKIVKCKDCKHFSVCQIREPTENPNVEIECSEYKERD